MNMRMLNPLSRKLYNFPRRVFGVSQNVIDYTSKENPRVFFTIAKDGKSLGNLTFEVINFLKNIYSKLFTIHSYTTTTALRPPRTSSKSAAARTRASSPTRTTCFTESFLVSWLREETSPRAMVPEACPSTAVLSRTRT